MNKENKIRNIFSVIVVLVLILVATGVMVVVKNKNVDSSYLDSFAKCLTEKQVTMYGASWCSHCQNQKKLFGSAFQFATYVECTENEKLCLDRGVEAFPTWINGAGLKKTGELSLAQLAEFSGCVLPVKP